MYGNRKDIIRTTPKNRFEKCQYNFTVEKSKKKESKKLFKFVIRIWIYRLESFKKYSLKKMNHIKVFTIN